MRHIKSINEFQSVKANWGTEGDMEQLNGLMQGNKVSVKKAKEIYESLSKVQKDKFHSYWVEANSDFGEDLYSGKKVTTTTAIKTIKYLLYEQDIAKHAEGGEVTRTSKSLNIVKGEISDLSDIFQINQNLTLDGPEYKVKRFVWNKKTWIKSEIEHGNFYIAKSGSEIVGAMCLVIDEDCAYIETLATKVKIGGVGKALVSFAIQKAKESGLHKITVESLCAYGVSGFYKKCGFIEKEKAPSSFGGTPYFSFYMNI